MCQHISVSVWSPGRKTRLDSTDPKNILANECTCLGVSVERSKTCHKKTESRMFAHKKLEESDVDGSYYESLEYGNPGKQLQATKTYEEKYMEVTA